MGFWSVVRTRCLPCSLVSMKGTNSVWIVRSGSRSELFSWLAEHLEKLGVRTLDLEVPASGVRGLSREQKKTFKKFKQTPEELIESWRVARYAEAATNPGDWVVFSDRNGTGGVFALEQSASPPAQRRRAVVLGGESETLRQLLLTRTVEGSPNPHAIDWELVSYRFATEVWTFSENVIEELGGLGVSAKRIPVDVRSVSLLAPRPKKVLLHEPASRMAHTGAILRGLSGYLDHVPDLQLAAEESHQADGFWRGSSWEALEGIRELFGDRIVSKGGFRPDVVVVGDRLAPPSEELVEMAEAGVPLLVPAGSMASAVFDDAPTWRDEDSLAEALSNPVRPVGRAVPDLDLGAGIDWRIRDRAERVSFGIPVFRNVKYLDRCLVSIFAQTQPPFEVLLMDDGSRSEDVDRAMKRWSGKVKVMRQPNRGVCVARNRMLEVMEGDAFVFVDSDDILEPGFVEKAAYLLRSRPDLDAVATWTEFFGAYDGIEGKPPFDARIGRRENPIISTCVLVDMRVRDLGVRFAPDLAFLYCEDWDFWAQIVGQGGRFGLVPEPLVRHRVHETSGGFKRLEDAKRVGMERAVAHLRDTR